MAKAEEEKGSKIKRWMKKLKATRLWGRGQKEEQWDEDIQGTAFPVDL